MIPLSPETPLPDWESPDVSALRDFLATATGKKLLPALAMQRPVLAGTSMESTALRAKLAEGFERCFSSLVQMAYPALAAEAQTVSPAYPPLEDEGFWKGTEPK